MRAIPPHLPHNVLNFLDPANTLFRLSHAMASYGQFQGRQAPTIFSARDRARTRVIGDSGGFQWATNKLRVENDGHRELALRWLESNCDIAMTLDAPTARLGKENCPWRSYDECLRETMANLRYFENKRTSSQLWLLNVIQGNTVPECVHWYNTVRIYGFEGWAFAGPLRHDIYHLLRMLILMHNERDLAKSRWIHILGTADLGTAVMLTAIQRGLKQHHGYNIRISFDTSTPFRMLAGNGVFGFPTLNDAEMRIEQFSAVAGRQYRGKRLMWPWSSALGDILYLNDVVVDPGAANSTQRDRLGNYLLALHNLQALCFAVRNANRVFDAQLIVGLDKGRKQVGGAQMRAIAAIEEVLRRPSLEVLADYAAEFQGVRKTYNVEESDLERDFNDDWVD
jgi:hypothetical protein